MSAEIDCPCQQVQPPEHEDALEVFGVLRTRCPVLRLLVPDDFWPAFAAWHRHDDEEAVHRSICLLALERGQLPDFTAPFHHFLIEGDEPHRKLRAQYLHDLQERWILKDTPDERHRKSRMLTGRLAELQLADWLENDGWTITGLEALREGPDIEANKASIPHAFEVKAIGTTDEGFDAIVKSLHNQPAGGWISLDTALDYLLFRAFEAGWQLRSRSGRRVAMIAIDALTWHTFESQLEEGWMDWAQPQFVGSDPKWLQFLASQNERYPSLLTDLRPVIASLDEIWIFQRLEGFKCRREHVITPKTAAIL